MKAKSMLRGLAGAALAAAITLGGGLFAEKPAAAMMPVIQDIPADRLLANLEAYVKEHPKDANGYARLARVQATLCIYRTAQAHEWSFRPNTYGQPQAENSVSDKDAETYAEAALKNFAQAIELDSKNAVFQLNVAFFMAQRANQAACAPYGMTEEKPSAAEAADCERLLKFLSGTDAKARDEAKAKLTALQGKALTAVLAHLTDKDAKIRAGAFEVLTAWWKEQATVAYWKAYAATIDDDMKAAEGNVFGGGQSISTEAAAAYETLVTADGARTPSDTEKKNLETIKTNRDTVAKKQAENQKNGGPRMMRSVSPIVFSLDAAKPLNQLVDASKMVPFDLDGDDVVEQRAWVKADTAILVWDPKCEGKITSGRQLFGNVTWWIFWNNGYEALDALDDNRDGQLTGAELTGLAVWRDANQNGISDPGEVVPVVNVGIDAIAVRAPEMENGCPANKTGLHLTNGKTLPTYDWYATGVAK